MEQVIHLGQELPPFAWALLAAVVAAAAWPLAIKMFEHRQFDGSD